MAAFDFFEQVVQRAGQRRPADISVVGAGVRWPGHLTLETVEVLRACTVVYTLMPGERLGWFIQDLGTRVEDLTPLYEPGRYRPSIYAELSEHVLRGAAEHRPVAYLVDGNPIVFNVTTQEILRGGPARGLTVRVFPAVSAIDTVLVDLNQDIGFSGLQIYDASGLVLYRIEPRVDVPCLLLQPQMFGTAYAAVGHEPMPNALNPLRDHLLRFYPPEHEVTFIWSAVWWYEDPEIHRLPLSGLDSVGWREVAGASMFIPALRKLEPDQDFLASLEDLLHFRQAFRPLP